MTSKLSALQMLLILSLLLGMPGSAAQAQQLLGSGFNVQGHLQFDGAPAQGSFDLQFRLFASAEGGSALGDPVLISEHPIEGGWLDLTLDFGPDLLASQALWLELRARPAGEGTPQPLSPRIELSARPYAWAAARALPGSVTGSSLIEGSLDASHIVAGSIQRRVAEDCAAAGALRGIGINGQVACTPVDLISGTVTSIETGEGLEGGPITESGTLSISPGAVGSSAINSTEVQRRVTGSCAEGQYIRMISQNGNVICGTDNQGGPLWRLDGNEGIDPDTQFLGTTNTSSLVIRTHNVQSGRLVPSTTLHNGIPATANLIFGSAGNATGVSTRGAVISGGGVYPEDSDPNYFDSAPNQVLSAFTSVGGGLSNIAGGQGSFATVAGGRGNRASRLNSAVGGGRDNEAKGNYSVVRGGRDNHALGESSVVGGGRNNMAWGGYSTVPGGRDNCAGGSYSWAGGRRAKILPGLDPGYGACSGLPASTTGAHSGTFMWADSQDQDYLSARGNQFLVRAAGGAVFTTNSSSNSPLGNRLNVVGRLRVDDLDSAAATALCRNTSQQLAHCSSSQRYKHAIEELALDPLLALQLQPVSFEWREDQRLDIGFIAEHVAELDSRLVELESGQIEGLRHHRISVVLLKAVQELSLHEQLLAEQVQALQEEEKALRRQLAQLKGDAK